MQWRSTGRPWRLIVGRSHIGPMHQHILPVTVLVNYLLGCPLLRILCHWSSCCLVMDLLLLLLEQLQLLGSGGCSTRSWREHVPYQSGRGLPRDVFLSRKATHSVSNNLKER